MQDRKQQVQWNKDPPVQQLNFKQIGTYRPRYLNGYGFSSSRTSSEVTNQTKLTNLSLPDLDTVHEDSIISVENGMHVPNVGDVYSSIAITQSIDPHEGRLRSASMNELLDDMNSRHATNPLHDSDDSNIQMSPTSKVQLLTDNVANPLRDSEEPSRQKNGIVHHTISTDDHSSNEGDSTDCTCAVNNTTTFSVNFTNNKDTSILPLAAV